jgi:hypothetical protein
METVMSTTITVSDEIIEHLNELSAGLGEDVDDTLRELLIAEYRRRLTRYQLTSQQLMQKYGLDFDTFEQRQVTKQQGFSWEVESDGMVWETAVDGIATMKRRLTELMHGAKEP